MDLSMEEIEGIAGAIPCETVVYLVEGDTLKRLYVSEGVPTLSGGMVGDYESIAHSEPFELVAKQDREMVMATIRRGLEEDRDFEAVYRIIRPGESSIWVHARGRKIGYRAGNPVILCVIDDVSSENEQQFALLENAQSPVYVVERSTYELLYINGASIDLFDKPAPIFGQICYAYKHGYDMPCPGCPILTMEGDLCSLDAYYQPDIDRWLQYDFRKIQWFGRDAVAVYAYDITEHRRALNEMRKNRELVSSAMDAAKLIVWEYDIATHRIDMDMSSAYTRSICKSLGIPETIPDGPTALALVIEEEDRKDYLEMYRRIDEGAEEAGCEFGFKMEGDPKTHYERVTCKVVRNARGDVLTVFGIGQDITAQVLEQRRNRRLFTVPDSLGSFRHNLTTNWTGDGQSSYPEVLALQASGTCDGYSQAVADTMVDEKIKTDFLARCNRQALLDAFWDGTDRLDFDYPMRYDDLSLHWIRGTLNLMQNIDTGDVEAVTYAIDVTKEKRNAEIVERIMSDDIDYIGLIDVPSGTFEFVKKSSRIQFLEVGQKADYEALREYVRRDFASPAELTEFDEATDLERIVLDLREKGRCSATYRRIGNGATACIQLNYSWLEEVNGEILVTRSDVTAAYEREQRRVEELQAAMLAADRANESKSSFLSGMSHDIRTPLNGIIGFTEFALAEDDLSTARDYMQKVKASASLLLGLVNDVLDLSRIESGKMILDPVLTPVDEVGASVIEALRPAAKERGVELISGPYPDKMVYLDKLKFQKVWLNLVSNAIKYTPAGGTVKAWVELIEPPVDGHNRRLIVEDTGIGMTEEFQKVMFEPFSQERRSETSNSQGTGLGLSIVKRIVDLLGGTIKVESSCNRGTRFEVEVFIQTVEEDAGTRKVVEHRKADFEGARVLLCEDNEMNAEITRMLLMGKSIEMEWAEDGKKGVEMFSASEPGHYDAILMDVRMPVMGGREATRTIRALGREDATTIPIIAITADAFEEDLRENRAAGMDGCVTKPVNPDLLFKALQDIGGF